MTQTHFRFNNHTVCLLPAFAPSATLDRLTALLEVRPGLLTVTRRGYLKDRLNFYVESHD